MESALILMFVVSLVQPQVGPPAAQAFAKQYELDRKLDEFAKRLTTQEQRERIGSAAILTKLAVERSITLKWEF